MVELQNFLNAPRTFYIQYQLGYIFLPLTVYAQRCKFPKFYPKARTPTHWMPSSDQILTQNDHSRSFKVIRFGVNKEPLRGYIVLYNNCGHECEGSEDVASERSENRHIRRPHSFDALFPANPREYPYKSYIARNQVPWATISSLTMYRQLFKFSNSFVRKPETPTHQLPSPKQILTQNGHSGSFQVIYFDDTEEPVWDYMAQYNNCGLRCGSSEVIAGKISENRHF